MTIGNSQASAENGSKTERLLQSMFADEQVSLPRQP